MSGKAFSDVAGRARRASACHRGAVAHPAGARLLPGISLDYVPWTAVPLMQVALARARELEIQKTKGPDLQGFASMAETRTRTGDTTIFSRAPLSLKSVGLAGHYRRSGVPRSVQIPRILRLFSGVTADARTRRPFHDGLYAGDENRAAPPNEVVPGYDFAGVGAGGREWPLALTAALAEASPATRVGLGRGHAPRSDHVDCSTRGPRSPRLPPARVGPRTPSAAHDGAQLDDHVVEWSCDVRRGQCQPVSPSGVSVAAAAVVGAGGSCGGGRGRVPARTPAAR